MTELFPDYYKILEVPLSATPQEIKRAWHAKMREVHPDRHVGEYERYEKIAKEVNLAYRVLSNSNERAAYDLERKRFLAKAKKVANPNVPVKKSVPAKKKAETSFWGKIFVGTKFSEKPLGFVGKLILTLASGIFPAFFFGAIPWGKCDNVLAAYLLGGAPCPEVSLPFFYLTLPVSFLFFGVLICGKIFRAPLSSLSMFELFIVALACAGTFILPLKAHGDFVFWGLVVFGGLCVFRSFSAQSWRIAGTLLRSGFLVLCVVIYRLTVLMFEGVDVLVSGISFLLISAFLAAWLCAELSSASR